MTEEWRAARGYEGLYSVSNLGRVISHPRLVRTVNGYFTRTRIMKVHPKKSLLGKQSYNLVVLSGDGVQKTHKVAPLIAAAFHGPAPVGMICRHKDGNGLNDQATNLIWGTHSENAEDSYLHGTLIYGNAHPNRTIDEAMAFAIYLRRGETAVAVSAALGVSLWVVYGIWSGRKWRRAIENFKRELDEPLGHSAKTTRPPVASRAESFLDTKEQ